MYVATMVMLSFFWSSFAGEEGLLVEKILPGGAIEAWNKQCPGEVREIRPGDSAPCMFVEKCLDV